MEQSEKVIDIEMKEGEGKSSSPAGKRKSEVSDSIVESPAKKQLKASSEEMKLADKEAKEAEEALLKDDEEEEGSKVKGAAPVKKSTEEGEKAAVKGSDKDKENQGNVEEIGTSDDVDTEPEQNGSNEKDVEEAPKEAKEASN
jgi:hypothetical protein